jgi:hypothetical protein
MAVSDVSSRVCASRAPLSGRMPIAETHAIRSWGGHYRRRRGPAGWDAHRPLAPGGPRPVDAPPVPRRRSRPRRPFFVGGSLQQDTGSRSVVVRYPLHPLAGRSLQVVERRRGPPPTYYLITPEGEGFSVPVWMTQEAAAGLLREDFPRLDLRALRVLAALTTKKGLESASDHEEILPSDQAKEGARESQPTPVAADTPGAARRTARTASASRCLRRDRRGDRQDARASRRKRRRERRGRGGPR